MYNVQPHLPAFANPVADVFLDDFSLEEVADRVSSLCTESNLIRLSGLLLAGVQMGVTSALIGGSTAFFLSSAVAIVVTASAFKVAQNYEAYCQLPLVYRAQLSAFQMIFGDFDDVAALNERARNLCVAIRAGSYANVQQLVVRGGPLNLAGPEGFTPLQLALMVYEKSIAVEFLRLDRCQVSSEELDLVLGYADEALLNLALPKFQGILSPEQEVMVQRIRNGELQETSAIVSLIQSYAVGECNVLPAISHELDRLILVWRHSDYIHLPLILIAARETNDPELIAHVGRLFAEAFVRSLDEHNASLAVALINSGVDINALPDGSRPLRKAISNNLQEVVVSILKREDYVIEQGDVGRILGYENQAVVEQVIQKHAWQLSGYELGFLLMFMHFGRGVGLTYIYLTLRGEENIDLLRGELLALKNRFDNGEFNSRTICKFIFNAHVQDSDVILRLCEEIFPDLIEESRVYRSQKKLSHVLGLRRGEWGYEYNWAVIAKRIFSSYFRQFPNEFSNEVVEAMEGVQQHESVRDLVQKIVSGELFVFVCGWEGHEISLVMYKDWIVVCNRGEESLGEPGFKVYRYNRRRLLGANSPEEASLDLLKMLMSKNREYFSPNPDAESFYEDLGVQQILYVPLKQQKVHNCMWVAFKSAAYAAEVVIQAYSNMERNRIPDNLAIEDAVVQVKPKYKALSRYSRQVIVDSEYPTLKQSPLANRAYLRSVERKIRAKGLRLPNVNLAPADQS